MTLPEKGSTVVVGLSGGVDSSMTAILLKEYGCNVICATMSTWNGDLDLKPNHENIRSSCYGPDEAVDIEVCKKFCAENDFEYHVIDVKKQYRENVLDYYKNEYLAGKTPNPCIFCNPSIKFGAFLDGIRNEGIRFDYFCTGHYANLVRPSENLVTDWDISKKDESGEKKFPLLIQNASDTKKDQTYFLYRIPSETLEKVRFPLGSYTKKQVFEMAAEHHLDAAERAESQDFIPPEYAEQVFADTPSVPGDIVDLNGKVLGKHRGIRYYTVGQRRGLGISSPAPVYVQAIDAKNNRIVLGDNDSLLSSGLTANNWVWPNGCAPKVPFTAEVKIRLASPAVKAQIIPDKKPGTYTVKFAAPCRAVAPGQSVVLYINKMIAGGGIITGSINYG